ncbi:Uncharacterised protein [Escherichia coli]|nr:Uncharacterised protein [Escherichia coli]
MKPESKEAPINIRAKASQRDLIDMAANLVANRALILCWMPHAVKRKTSY